MQLFDKRKNIYIRLAIELSNMSINMNGLTKMQIDDYVEDNGVPDYNWQFVDAITDNNIANNAFGDINIFEKRGETYHSRLSAIPIVASGIEKWWLKGVIKEKEVELFLDKELKEKLENFLSDTCSTNMNDILLHKNLDKKIRPAMYTQNFRVIKQAIKEGESITCDNTTPSNVKYKEQVIVPYRFEYSLELLQFYLIGYSIEAERIIKLNLSRLSNISVTKESYYIDCEKELEARIVEEPIKIELTNVKNVLDRAFNLFSSYKKTGLYDSETNSYSMELLYYDYEEKDIIKKVLSLGEYVKVSSPERVISQIRDRITKQIKIFSSKVT